MLFERRVFIVARPVPRGLHYERMSSSLYPQFWQEARDIALAGDAVRTMPELKIIECGSGLADLVPGALRVIVHAATPRETVETSIIDLTNMLKRIVRYLADLSNLLGNQKKSRVFAGLPLMYNLKASARVCFDQVVLRKEGYERCFSDCAHKR